MHKSLVVLILFLNCLSACVSNKEALYFPNVDDAARFEPVGAPEHIIRKDDLLSITVSSSNPEASQIFNLPNTSNAEGRTQTGEVQRPAGYLVRADGSIAFPLLGAIKAEGLSKQQLQEVITTALIQRKLLLDPIVDVRHLNFKVTVLGEVSRPTVITVANEKITLLEALGLAGDLTIFGKRSTVLLLRDEGGQRVARRINLNSSELLTSPYYYLKADDVIYVEPNRARVASRTRLFQVLPLFVSGLSASIFILDRLLR
ncbi:polysaccharide biosynthesis/export family protein [Cesiribacter andamanensis]|uniref:Polysaccharide export protein Wza n=1 Tax=Cesiribacter andamanensis AMV16 TaxID=1279009 RepID=M7NVR6_9BACT|nr:polysaccharide biosynthesis/export family protein [Cesiribacter andamanensis]EMR02569.1 polysaccharide export protein Wza [Cesiribacter andamanensis AMV16]